MRLKGLMAVFLLIFICACDKDDKTAYIEEIPTLNFEHIKYNEEGKECFYLFDDNPEHLNPDFLSDGETPSSIAHFEGLKPGVYTLFSYHHRGSSAEKDEDLFFDVLFRGSGEIKISRVGIDHDWNWNKVWADFSGTEVYAPHIINSYNCTCPQKACSKPNAVCPESCGCAVLNTTYTPKTSDTAKTVIRVGGDDGLLLSEIMKFKERENEIRHGGATEPVWLMMEFEVIIGEVSLDTVAYRDKNAAREKFPVMKNGRVNNEPQYKGIANCSPCVTAELSYTFDDRTGEGLLPVRLVSQKYPDGYVADGSFATNVNTWKDTEITPAESAESDLLSFVYRDGEKPELYGMNVVERSDIWHFDPFHTRLYAKDDADFVPNIPISMVDYPMFTSEGEREFYKEYVLNLGNFGVRYIYNFNLKNSSDEDKIFVFSMNSVSGQVYRYDLTRDGVSVKNDGGKYKVKKFDNDPAEVPFSDKRQKPAKYTTEEEFLLKAGEDYKLRFEVVTLTGCDAPIVNTLKIKHSP